MLNAENSQKPTGSRRFELGHFPPQRIGRLYQELNDNEDALEQLIETGKDAFRLISLLDAQASAGRILEVQNIFYRMEREYSLLASLVRPELMEDLAGVAEDQPGYGQELP